MIILQSGQAVPNLPDLYVNIVPPQTNFLSPAETDILGIVGSATWGPVNSPTLVGSLADYATKFGLPQNRKYDMGTPLWTANLQGAQNFRCVRVTDTTDIAATGPVGLNGAPTLQAAGTGYAINDIVTLANGATIKVLTVSSGAIATFSQQTQPTSQPSNSVAQTSTTGSGSGATFTYTYSVGLTLTAKYTGSTGNTLQAIVAAGSQTGTWKITLFLPNVSRTGEVYDNIGLGLTGTNLWAAVVAAINNGNAQRGPSNLGVASAGTSTGAPYAQTVTLTGGTDGASGVTATMLVGADVSPRTGMYALRGQGCSVGMLSDCDTSTTWAAQVAFGLSEGVYMIGVGPAGDTVSNATTVKASAGIDSYAFKLLFGDWCYFLDTINGLTRLVSPQGFVAGWIAAWGPQFSSLNKQLQGIVGTQKSASNQVWMRDDLTTLNGAGIDIITNPVPGGSYFGARMGHNSSSNSSIRGDNYTRMTNFIAATINEGLGQYVGQLQSPTEQKEAKASLDAFFQDLWDQGAIGAADPTKVPYSTTISTNPTQIAEGKQIANCKVIYLSVIEEFIVNVEGGQTVTIPSANPQPLQPLV